MTIFRHITAWDADASVVNPDYPSPPGLLANKTFRQGVAMFGRGGLSFETAFIHPQIGALD